MALWKDVAGYEGLYLVNEDGVIISLPREVSGKNASGEIAIHRKGKRIKPYLRGKG